MLAVLLKYVDKNKAYGTVFEVIIIIHAQSIKSFLLMFFNSFLFCVRAWASSGFVFLQPNKEKSHGRTGKAMDTFLTKFGKEWND